MFVSALSAYFLLLSLSWSPFTRIFSFSESRDLVFSSGGRCPASVMAHPDLPILSSSELNKLCLPSYSQSSIEEFVFFETISSGLCPVPGCGFDHGNSPEALNRHHYSEHPGLALVFYHWTPPNSIGICLECNSFVPPGKPSGKQNHHCPSRLRAKKAGPARRPKLVMFEREHWNILRSSIPRNKFQSLPSHQPASSHCKSHKLCPVPGCTFYHDGRSATSLNKHTLEEHPNLDLTTLPLSDAFLQSRLKVCRGCNSYATTSSRHGCSDRLKDHRRTPTRFFGRPEDRAALRLDSCDRFIGRSQGHVCPAPGSPRPPARPPTGLTPLPASPPPEPMGPSSPSSQGVEESKRPYTPDRGRSASPGRGDGSSGGGGSGGGGSGGGDDVT